MLFCCTTLLLGRLNACANAALAGTISALSASFLTMDASGSMYASKLDQLKQYMVWSPPQWNGIIRFVTTLSGVSKASVNFAQTRIGSLSEQVRQKHKFPL